MLRIGLDIDQCLADFMNPYLNRFGQPKNDYVITRHCTRDLCKDKDFWVNLPLIQVPDFAVTLYCTKRVNPKSYTKEWLRKNGLPDKPVYQIYYQKKNKADLIKGRVDVFIDDSVSNFIQMNKSGVPCLLMDCEFNRHFETPYRIYSLKYNEIEKVYNEYRARNFE